jgi:hypothetical protein
MVNGRTNRSILKEVVAGFWDGGTGTQTRKKELRSTILIDQIWTWGKEDHQQDRLTNPLLRRVPTGR